MEGQSGLWKCPLDVCYCGVSTRVQLKSTQQLGQKRSRNLVWELCSCAIFGTISMAHFNGIYLSAIFGRFVYSVAYRNTCTFSTKNGMVNLCANNGSFVNHSWHICALCYQYTYPFNQTWQGDYLVAQHFVTTMSIQVCLTIDTLYNL